MNKLGTLLFDLRRRRRLLQKQVAADAGIHASYLAGLERGRREAPSAEVLGRLAKVLKPSESERREMQRACALLRLERVLTTGQYQLESSDVLVRLAEVLPRLNDEEMHLLESFVALLARAAKRGEETP